MIGRRDLIIGAGCLAAAAAAYELKPRRRVSLLGPGRLADLLPLSLGEWSGRDVDDLVAPRTEGSLSAKLYGEVVERIYQQASTGAEIMMLMAYGDTQTNDLQLHRPEVCYPAFGFEISSSQAVGLALAKNVVLPARKLVADAPGRRETIVYWSRLGEFLPVSGNQQRLDRLQTSFRGYIADGLLARFSMTGDDPATSAQQLEAFIPLLVEAVPAGRRPVLVGTRTAEAMATAVSA